MEKNILLGWLLLILAGLSQTGCSSYGGQNSKQDTLQLPVITLSGKDTVLQTAYVADIQAIKNVEIRARVKGFLEGIYIDEGRLVKKGQILFKINDDEYKTALSKAHAALQNAEAAARATQLEVERVQLLVDRHVVVPSELEVAKARLAADKANIEEARSSVTSAENHLSYTSVRAPFDGLIDRIPLKPGSLIDEGTLLTSLSDISAMYAYFSFPENEYLQYQRTRHLAGQNSLGKDGQNSPGQPSHGFPNDKVKLVLADGSNYPYSGIIETVEGEIEQTTGSIDFRARFPNPQQLLRHGATARLYISTRADSVLLVPQRSVFDIQDKSYVYLVDKDNKLHMQSFEPLTRFSHYYIVKQGLHPSDRILYEGVQNVREGMVIKPGTANINL
ncbi:MAG TPA: efflux RND transporter periplasmic adaptor subunit [Puia sp.]|jgi:membrane fusion protein (multidrug efflux system)|nr:efflux RND transporter periplasmic adaptor subunit [Puia sp.]